MRLSELAAVLPVEETLNFSDVEIGGIRYLSDDVGSGDLFCCVDEFLRYGRWLSGKTLARDAAEKGAGAIITDTPFPDIFLPQLVVKDPVSAMAAAARHFYGYPDRKMTMIGITGTNGKTTVSHLTAHLLEASGMPAAGMGTIGIYRKGIKQADAVYTTPLSPDLYRILHELAEKNIDAAVMEVSSHALKLGRISGLSPEGAVFTNLTRDHLDFHGTPEDYAESKLKLFRMLKNGGFGVINMDDPAAPSFADAVSERIIGYGISNPADIRAEEIRYRPDGTRFRLVLADGSFQVSTRLIGRFNVYNALAALGVVSGLGIDPESAVDALAEFRSVPGRMEIVPLSGSRVGVVDYAHTPDALENVLETLREITNARIITVFGCGGDRDRGKRPEMGAIAERLSDLCIVTSDNPRTEDPKIILDDIMAGMEKTADTIREPDRKAAIKKAFEMSREGDVILVAGKGHEDYQIKGVTKIHFSDREELECLG